MKGRRKNKTNLVGTYPHINLQPSIWNRPDVGPFQMPPNTSLHCSAQGKACLVN